MIIGTYMKNYCPNDKVYKSTYLGKFEKQHRFLCDCGIYFKVNHSTRLKNEGNFSCRDCYNKSYSEKHDPDWGYKLIIKRIKSDANLADRNFDITIEQFKELCHRDCFYCGSAPSNTSWYKNKRSFTYSGLDRLDNDLGYNILNVVPCCIICNRAKNSMPIEDFLLWIDKLISHNNKIKNSENLS